MPSTEVRATGTCREPVTLPRGLVGLGPINLPEPAPRGRALARQARRRRYVAELEDGGPLPLVSIVEGSRARVRASVMTGRATVAQAAARAWTPLA